MHRWSWEHLESIGPTKLVAVISTSDVVKSTGNKNQSPWPHSGPRELTIPRKMSHMSLSHSLTIHSLLCTSLYCELLKVRHPCLLIDAPLALSTGASTQQDGHNQMLNNPRAGRNLGSIIVGASKMTCQLAMVPCDDALQKQWTRVPFLTMEFYQVAGSS